MNAVMVIVLLIDAFVGLKILGSMWRAKFDKKIYADDTYYARIGFLALFHLIMGAVAVAVFVITKMVKATL